MCLHCFRFARPPDERAWRARLRHEVGARRSSERNVETSWRDEPEGAGGALEILSMDAIALAYATKVCLELGAEPVSPTGERRARAPPPWTATRWVAMPWLTEARIWLGPTQL
jgi:hypothetical protein